MSLLNRNYLIFKLDLKAKHQKYDDGKIHVINRKNGNQDSLDSRFASLQSSESGYLRREPLMNHYKIPQEVNNSICEAVNCFSPAEVQIEVKVGHLDNISVSLCNDCVCKFRDEQ